MFKPPVPAARRAGMLAAGITLWIGFGLLVLSCLEFGLERRLTALPVPRPHEVLLGVWPLAAVVGLAVCLLVRAYPTVLREANPVKAFVVPAAGAASLMPLTVQMLFGALTGGRAALADFGEWAVFGLGLTAIAHVWFVAQVGQRASDLAVGFPPSTVTRIYWTTILAGAVPGIIFLGVPCLVIAITGLPILPMLHAMERYARLDRDATELPLARLVVA